MQQEPLTFYEGRIRELNHERKLLLDRQRMLGWTRLLSFIFAFIALWQLWQPFGILAAFITFFLILGLFIYLVVQDLKNKEAIENNRLLTELNKTEINILKHSFINRADGAELKPDTHDYANDLDIFGKASLYEYINRTNSEQGNKLLANWLLHPATKEQIKQRQQASTELKENIPSLQQFLAYGIAQPVTTASEKKVTEWLKSENKLHSNTWKILRYAFPAITISILLLHIFEVIPAAGFYPLVILFFAISMLISRYLMPEYVLLNKIVPELETIYNGISWIETASFKNELLNEVKNKFTGNEIKASSSVKQLKKILERLDYRFNPLVFVPLNVFLLWDLQQVMQLEKWRSANNKNITAWFHALAEMESLITLSLISFNHPSWCHPSLENKDGVFIAEELGHPLIRPDKCVNNSFATHGNGELNLITGSNMAGKSTFLRSVGVNTVLAMMGAPVCAKQMSLSWMKIMSTMRVNDNLEESTSTFYAELKKLKSIIEAVNKNEKVFLLLDEILRGTNSADRHTGSKALIRQLIHHKAAGLVATHDLELAKLANEFPDSIHNYHFDVHVKNEELYFDYKLKQGICTSMNASLLMKKIGIELI